MSVRQGYLSGKYLYLRIGFPGKILCVRAKIKHRILENGIMFDEQTDRPPGKNSMCSWEKTGFLEN